MYLSQIGGLTVRTDLQSPQFARYHASIQVHDCVPSLPSGCHAERPGLRLSFACSCCCSTQLSWVTSSLNILFLVGTVRWPCCDQILQVRHAEGNYATQTWKRLLQTSSRTSSTEQKGPVGLMQHLQGGLFLSRQGSGKTAKPWISVTSLLASGWRTVMMRTLLMLVS